VTGPGQVGYDSVDLGGPEVTRLFELRSDPARDLVNAIDTASGERLELPEQGPGSVARFVHGEEHTVINPGPGPLSLIEVRVLPRGQTVWE